VRCWSSSPTIRNCRFTSHVGATFQLSYSDARFENCLFQGNSAQWAMVINCVAGQPVFLNCSFLHNNAMCLYLDFTTARLINSVFHGNNSTGGNPTIELHGGMPVITNCTITGNTAPAGSAALFLTLEPMVSIRNSILWGNSPQDILIAPGEPSYLTVRYSNVTGGYAGDGNINSDPLFVNVAAHDFDLASGSPCTDAANNAAVPAGVVTDILGRPRFVNDPFKPDSGVGPPPVVDMGAYEHQSPFVLGDINCSGAVTHADVDPFVLALIDPAAYVQQFPTCSLTLADVNDDGAVDALDIASFVALLLD
jgi:hypothetical protein